MVAARWLEPFLRRYHEWKAAATGSEKETDLLARYPDLKAMFEDIDVFYASLRSEFGEVDAEIRAGHWQGTRCFVRCAGC